MSNNRFLDFSRIFENAARTFLRFPIVLLLAILGTYCAMRLATHNYTEPTLPFAWTKTVMLCGLGISLIFSLALLAERQILKIPSLLAQGLGAVVLAAYYFILPHEEKNFSIFWVVQLLAVGVSAHLLVSFAPYIKGMNENGFWQYNKTLFINILTALFYSYTLFLGLVLALMAIKQLFHVEVHGNTFTRLFFFLQGIFNTWFFLSKVPENIENLNESDEYPIGLKLFSQYVLLPLVLIYLLILYAYEAKIMLTMRLPVGWVSYLVLGFSVVGILCFLLLYPFGKKQENAWITQFSRWFYIILLPLIALMLFAIGYRVSQYGVTENRYYVLLSGLWLLGIALYFIFSKRDNIAVVPISLCLITFLSGLGFWGASSVSLRSQKNRLTGLFEQYQLDGGNKKHIPSIPRKDALQISEITEYFVRRNEMVALYPLFKVTPAMGLDTLPTYTQKDSLLSLVNVPEYNYWDSSDSTTTDAGLIHYFSMDESDENGYLVVMEVKGYDYVIGTVNDGEQNAFVFGNQKFTIQPSVKDGKLTFTQGKQTYVFDLFAFYKEKLEKIKNSVTAQKIPPATMTFNFEQANYSAKFQIHQLNIWEQKSDLTLQSMNYRFWVKLK
ncbi:MAG: hypothetical protein RLZZ292_746 [Bacteroidota bacterium]|jgi:hypothetical protein